MHTFQLVKISNANSLLKIPNSAWPKWDVHVVSSDGKHALLSVANLHYTLPFVVDRKEEVYEI